MRENNKDKLAYYGIIGVSMMAIAVLLWIIIYIGIRGIAHINLAKLFLPIVTTIYMVLIALMIAVPIGIGGAIYLNEYAKEGKLVSAVTFATECLAAVPSIIFGLFGMMFFVITLKMGYSLLAGSLTVAMVILPTIVKTTQEALKTVPNSYREASLALGATKYRTIFKVILPSAMAGTLTGIVLAIGRIVGETAAIYLTAGTMLKMPQNIMDSGRTLSVHLYMLAKEGISFEDAYGTSMVLLVVILMLNLSIYFIAGKVDKAKGK